MKPETCTLPMAKYSARQAGRLLGRLEDRMERARKRRDAGSVHDLRVAVRRLAACLRTFQSLFPAADARKVRRRLKEILERASAVRDCDVALDLWRQAGMAADSPIRSGIEAARNAAERKLLAILERRRESAVRWRGRLEL
jgi:CHAD domain-containing protein